MASDGSRRGRTREQTERISWSKKDGKAFTHGIPNGYRTHGCGCDPCWEAYRDQGYYKRALEVSRAASDKAQPGG